MRRKIGRAPSMSRSKTSAANSRTTPDRRGRVPTTDRCAAEQFAPLKNPFGKRLSASPQRFASTLRVSAIARRKFLQRTAQNHQQNEAGHRRQAGHDKKFRPANRGDQGAGYCAGGDAWESRQGGEQRVLRGAETRVA